MKVQLSPLQLELRNFEMHYYQLFGSKKFNRYFGATCDVSNHIISETSQVTEEMVKMYGRTVKAIYENAKLQPKKDIETNGKFSKVCEELEKSEQKLHSSKKYKGYIKAKNKLKEFMANNRHLFASEYSKLRLDEKSVPPRIVLAVDEICLEFGIDPKEMSRKRLFSEV